MEKKRVQQKRNLWEPRKNEVTYGAISEDANLRNMIPLDYLSLAISHARSELLHARAKELPGVLLGSNDSVSPSFV